MTIVIASIGKLTKGKILEGLGVPESSPLHFVAEYIANLVLRETAKAKTAMELLKVYDVNVIDELPEVVREAIEGGMKVYVIEEVGLYSYELMEVDILQEMTDMNTSDLIISKGE